MCLLHFIQTYIIAHHQPLGCLCEAINILTKYKTEMYSFPIILFKKTACMYTPTDSRVTAERSVQRNGFLHEHD